jgi:hypothetical protein
MFGGSVVDGGSGDELSAPRLYVSLMSDIGADRVVNPSVVIELGKTPLYLNGIKYDSKGCHEKMEPTQEVQGWYALNGPFRVKATKDGGYDFVTLEGKDRADRIAYNGGWKEDDPRLLANRYKRPDMKECRKIWKPYLDGTRKVD